MVESMDGVSFAKVFCRIPVEFCLPLIDELTLNGLIRLIHFLRH